jgi:non-specific serine/threonine protein kinase
MHHFQGHCFEDVTAEALALGRENGDTWVTSFALFMQGLAALQRGDCVQATERSLQAREAASLCGDEVQEAGPLLVLANIAVLNGDYDRAQLLYDEAIAVERRAGEVWGLSILLSAAAGLRIVRKDFDEARELAAEAMSLCQELEDPRGIAWSLDVFAGLLAAGGHSMGAARLWGASDRVLGSVAGLLSPEIKWLRDRYIESVEKSLGTDEFENARAQGRTMPLLQAIALARQPPIPLP